MYVSIYYRKSGSHDEGMLPENELRFEKVIKESLSALVYFHL